MPPTVSARQGHTWPSSSSAAGCDDAAAAAGRLADGLKPVFGDASVFADTHNITPGSDFPSIIDANLADCAVLLAGIGRRWLDQLHARVRKYSVITYEGYARKVVE